MIILPPTLQYSLRLLSNVLFGVLAKEMPALVINDFYKFTISC